MVYIVGVLLLIATAFGEIYFEEDFEDDSWRERWVTPTPYDEEEFGKFERSTVVSYGGTNNTGLGTTKAISSYFLFTRFSPITMENKTFVMQFSVKIGRIPDCDNRFIRLYGCYSEIQWKTPPVLEFGPETCGDYEIWLNARNLWGQRIRRTIKLPFDKRTHVHTLILRPSGSYEIIFDDGTVYRKSGSVLENQKQLATMYPKICGIGFRFHQTSGGTIFDDISLSDDIVMAKSKRDDILAQTTRWKFGGTSILVDIAAEDLSKILDCKRNIDFGRNNRTRLIFDDFDKFLVPLNWNDNSTVIMATAEYNRLRGASNESIQLWVSFVPHNEDILDDLDSVLKVVNEANSISPKTVTTIVISYGFLNLDQRTLPFINHEIRKVSKRLKLLPVQVADLGLQISDINCRSNRRNAKYLETNLFDFLVIMPMPQTKQFNARDSDKILSFCVASAGLMDMAVPPLIHSYESVGIDFENKVYIYNKTFAQKYKNLYLHAMALIRAGDKIRKEDIPDTEQGPKSKNLANWLYQPTNFNKFHFGAVVNWKDIKLMGVENFASTILERFSHIMLDISTHDDLETEDHLEPIIEEIHARYSLLMKKQEGIGNQIPKGNTQLRMGIVVTIESNDVEVNERQADRAISAAYKCNTISPGSVKIVYFDLLACSRSEICSGHNKNGLEMVCVHAERVGNLSDFFNHALFSVVEGEEKGEGGRVRVWLGRVEDEWMDKLKLEYKSKECPAGSHFGEFDISTNHILCKTIMRHEDIANYGAFKASNIIIESFSFCSYFGEADEDARGHFYVNIVGCVGGHSNMTLLVEYALLMEYLNKWAETDEILLFINAGVEPSKCNASERLPEKECDCGWWIQQAANGTYQDKKSVARQLYEIAEGISITDDVKKRMVVTPTSLLWLWILIPVLIVGALITIPAVFLIFYYRSKYILTKREVEAFIKGRQTTRPEPVGDGDEAAETLSYNREKYELSPSTFTIDITSRCLGSGEYGRVYPGSIRRDGEIIEAAVKMANASLVRKSHGYYLALKGLLSEIKILAYVGEHNHIVSLLGAYTKNVRKGEIAVFLELCQLGSLDKYLHTMEPQLVGNNENTYSEESAEECNDITDDKESSVGGNIHVLDKESSEELFRWAGEIANGMEFLASKKLVHADLATRNVLLTVDKVAKISDFGLSRRLYDYTEYVKHNQAPLPWRWMSPESLRRMVFTEKTDIWAFGVTLWEIFTLGDKPYPGLTWNMDFSALLERGLRLPEPRFNMKQIYLVMLRCWDICPALRPTFAQLKSELNPV